MQEKKITLRLPQKNYEFLKGLFPDDSDYHASGLFVEECENIFIETIREVKLFTPAEIGQIIDVCKNWIMDFSKQTPKQSLISMLTKHFEIELFTKMPKSLVDKIGSITEFQCYVLLRMINKLKVEKDMGNKIKFLFSE